MDARDRFVTALAKAVSTMYYAEGDIFLSIEEVGDMPTSSTFPKRRCARRCAC
jgi:hypothetical protein